MGECFGDQWAEMSAVGGEGSEWVDSTGGEIV